MKVVYYEGLFGSIGRWLYRGLIKELKPTFKSVEFVGRCWWDSRPLPEDTILVIGHSFGGYRALKVTSSIPTITIDPRWWNPKVFESLGHDKVCNYIQMGLMPGSFVEETAKQVIVYDGESHIELPKNEDIYWQALSAINESMGSYPLMGAISLV